MNQNQTDFLKYWDRTANNVFYKVIKITDEAGVTDKILDNQRKELSRCIKNEINRVFFDFKLRPEAAVWFENLKKEFPKEAKEWEEKVKECEITSKGLENIITMAAGGTSALTGIALRKKKILPSALLILGGIAVTGHKLISGLSIDTQVLQKEVRNQFEVWKAPLLEILESCEDTGFAQDEDEQ